MTLLDLFQKAPREMRAQAQTFATEQERAEGEALAVMMDQYAAALEDATTPRKPEPEWFDRWPSWWIDVGDGGDFYRAGENSQWMREEVKGRDCMRFREYGHLRLSFDLSNAGTKCLPVAREGYPAPAGWQVLEVKEGT